MTAMANTDDDDAFKNSLYAFEGQELTNSDLGQSRGILRRVRAAYDFCEFEVAGGDTVRRDLRELRIALRNGYEFEEVEN